MSSFHKATRISVGLAVCLIWQLSAITKAAEIRFSSIAFDKSGAPKTITCMFLLRPHTAEGISAVLLSPNHITYTNATVKILGTKNGNIEVEATIDLSKCWVAEISKPLAEGDWTLPVIAGKRTQVADGKGFIKVLEVSDTMQIGFSLGRADLDADAKVFLKAIDKVENDHRAEPAGADQPATKPADKPPVKDQPSTPTPKPPR